MGTADFRQSGIIEEDESIAPVARRWFLRQPLASATIANPKEPYNVVKDIERNQGVQCESAILVGVFLSDHANDDELLEELGGLAETAGAEVVGRLTQRRDTPDVTT